MTIQNVADKYKHNNHFVDHPNIDYLEIEGIKLRDSVFVVYPPDSSYEGSEFIYSLNPIGRSEEIIFDYDQDISGNFNKEVCGAYTADDHRVLNITEMNNWHFKGFIFKDENSWKKFLDLTK